MKRKTDQKILKFPESRSEQIKKAKQKIPKPDLKTNGVIPISKSVERIKKTKQAKEDWEITKLHMDAWLCELEEKTFARFAENFRDKPASFCEANSRIDTHDDGKHVWVSVGGGLRYALNRKTGMIHEATRTGVGKQYVEVKFWDTWCWSSHYPWKKDIGSGKQ